MSKNVKKNILKMSKKLKFLKISEKNKAKKNSSQKNICKAHVKCKEKKNSFNDESRHMQSRMKRDDRRGMSHSLPDC